ncbi:MAG: acid phosphatase [Comamonadaceae bacterium PBBC1]|nr:MAG: acid phosphatase [Comamonadaceae bacterium PBBC1]
MDYVYALTPFLAWLAAGVAKFAINSIRHRQMAFKLIGYGGLPSNHSAIVSSMAALIALKEGVQHPAFGVAVTLAFVVMLDAHSLRKQVGLQASAINDLNKDTPLKPPLRERMGHSLLEIVAGAVTGVVVAWSAYAWLI